VRAWDLVKNVNNLSAVAVGSIRPRILKVASLNPPMRPKAVAVGSIRPRILKAVGPYTWTVRLDGCSGLDPTEDTESSGSRHGSQRLRAVAVGSIRPRILKDP